MTSPAKLDDLDNSRIKFYEVLQLPLVVKTTPPKRSRHLAWRLLFCEMLRSPCGGGLSEVVIVNQDRLRHVFLRTTSLGGLTTLRPRQAGFSAYQKGPFLR